MKLETLAVHAGYSPDSTTRVVVVPIYQTTLYAFSDTQHGADLFDLKVPGNIYTRIMNPTNDVLKQRVVTSEGGVRALVVASGMAAITYAIQTVAEAGDNIVSVVKLYGGTYNLLAHTLSHIGIQARFAVHDDVVALEALIDERIKAVFCETIGNPMDNIIDLQALADAAYRHGVPLIVDNTVATPVLCWPFEHGVDTAVHSLTKYMGGHGISIGGIMIDSGKLNWAVNKPRFPLLNTPDPSHHDVTYTKVFGPAVFIGRCRVVPLRNMGAAFSPFDAFLILQGLETLALRMERHCDNALAVARYLQQHPQVVWVKYADFTGNLEHALARYYLGGRPTAILSFGTQGGSATGACFINALKLVVRLVNIGDVKSLACHPMGIIHHQLNTEELVRAGVFDDMVRLLIDIEYIDDILVDLDQALAAVVC